MRGRPALLLAAAALALLPVRASAQAPSASDSSAVPFALGDPVPNPFREAVRVPFRLGPPAEDGVGGAAGPEALGRDSARVSVAVYNVLWQRVAWARTGESADGGVPVRDRPYAVPGAYEVVWRGRARPGRRVPSGPYFIELRVDGRTAVRKVLLTR